MMIVDVDKNTDPLEELEISSIYCRLKVFVRPKDPKAIMSRDAAVWRAKKHLEQIGIEAEYYTAVAVRPDREYMVEFTPPEDVRKEFGLGD